MNDQVLIINSGSSSIKYCLYELLENSFDIKEKGAIERLGDDARLKVTHGKDIVEKALPACQDHDNAIRFILERLEDITHKGQSLRVGHRLVHGGKQFIKPVVINDDVIQTLKELADLAPLHLPYNLAAIMAFHKQYPGIPQVACFDTAFHAGHNKPVNQYGLPGEYYNEGIRRYGFHGLSYEYTAHYLQENEPALYSGNVLVAHLGNGSSLCALQNGKSIDTSMGFSTLDGLLMGSRSGSIDPGVLLYLLQNKNMTPDDIEELLYKHAGLLGVSGESNDMRDLLNSNTPAAREAIELYVYFFLREAGSLVNIMQGLDGLVFTGGIGENAADIRAMICKKMSWLGVEINNNANQENRPVISTTNSKVKACVVHADEEHMIAHHTLATLNQ